MNKLTVATLYGGIGGGMLGFVQAGYTPLWAADDRDFIDPSWLSQSWHNWMYSIQRRTEFPIFHSINTIDSHGIDSKIQIPNVMIGSPPCKRFSLLAVRKKDRLDFDPNELEYIKFLKAVDKLQPKAFVLENLVSIKKHFEWNNYLGEPILSEVGSKDYILSLPEYEVQSFVINSVDCNVPQKRKRLYVVGVQKSLVEHGFPHISPQSCETERTVGEAFKDLTGVPNMEVSKHSQKRIDGFAALKEGASYYGTQNNKRIHIDRPGPTITSHRTQYVHPLEPRTLTVRETSRLMGFPDTFEFFGPRTKQFDQVGCGICPPVAYHLAQSLKAVLNGVNSISI